MLKILLFLSFALSNAFSSTYPLIYAQLSHPLYESSEKISKLSQIEVSKYLEDLEVTKLLGYEVDENPLDAKKYLFKLRQLQKKYDAILNSLHKQIYLSIKDDDYQLFVHLTAYEFDGFLRSRGLYKKALKFYLKNKKINKIDFFEKKIKNKNLEIATSKEFYNDFITSTLSSTDTKKQKKKKVHLEAIDKGKYISVMIENLNLYSVTVNIDAEYENFNYDKRKRNLFALKAKEKKEYLKLYRKKDAMNHSYAYSYTWIIGSVDAVHDDTYKYRLPFARGTSHRVSQGYNGAYTHKGRSKYAIDFAMDVGTKIYASRDGTVVKLKENSNKGGIGKEFSSHGNYVTIEHSDNTLATYYHLKQDGVVVKIGDKVSKGAFIAYSGNTGNSSGPHLHLAIFKASNATRTQTLPVIFLSEDGIITLPHEGKSYTAK